MNLCAGALWHTIEKRMRACTRNESSQLLQQQTVVNHSKGKPTRRMNLIFFASFLSVFLSTENVYTDVFFSIHWQCNIALSLTFLDWNDNNLGGFTKATSFQSEYAQEKQHTHMQTNFSQPLCNTQVLRMREQK